MQLKKKTFLTEKQFESAKALFMSKIKLKSLDYESLFDIRTTMSIKLEEFLLSNINKVVPRWLEAKPLLQGSWSRLDLCPYSDLDILFLGPLPEVADVTEKLKSHQFKVMHRIPKNTDNWTYGVEPYDIFAYFYARNIANKAGEAEQLLKQKNMAFEFLNQETVKKQLISEKVARAKRYETVVNYLEPNLKYSPGGLRDIQQSLDLLLLTNESFAEYKEKLLYFKELFLVIRQFLHFNGYKDVLVAEAQQDLYVLLGFSSLQEFMKSVHIAFNESFFISKIVSDEIFLEEKRVSKGSVDSLEEAINQIHRDPSQRSQYLVRKAIKSFKFDKENYRHIGGLLNVTHPTGLLRAYFNSEILHLIEPELKRVKGWVQHDQYHKFCLDQHLLNTICAVVDIKNNPQGKIAEIAKELCSEDWAILMYSALYHDIGKGRKGDHSNVGADYFLKVSPFMALDKEVVKETEWIVRNHLLVSKLAFKKNSSSSEAAAEMVQHGLTENRLNRLTVFTAVDIIATNPEAWDSWKDHALYNLWSNYHQRDKNHFIKALESLSEPDRQLFNDLVPESLSGFSEDWLLEDLKQIKTNEIEKIAFYKSQEGQQWVRFYSQGDERGKALEAIKTLYALGLSVQQADFGSINFKGHDFVYDWFLVEGHQLEEQLKNKLSHIDISKLKIPQVDFDSVKLVSRNKQLATISIKGRDQAGTLLSAINAIYNADLDIVRAQVSTWGDRIDDVFTVKESPNLDNFLKLF